MAASSRCVPSTGVRVAKTERHFKHILLDRGIETDTQGPEPPSFLRAASETCMRDATRTSWSVHHTFAHNGEPKVSRAHGEWRNFGPAHELPQGADSGAALGHWTAAVVSRFSK